MPHPGKYFYECPRCGRYSLSGTLKALGDFPGDTATAGLVSHHLRRRQRPVGEPPHLDEYRFPELVESAYPPTPAEQAENLILWLGGALEAPGESIEIESLKHRAIIGAFNDANLRWLLVNARDHGLLEGSIAEAHRAPHRMTLSFAGWQRYQELRRSARDSRRAFMAMRFGDARLDKAYSAFRTGAKRAGFELFRLDENAPAGLIDDRLRVEIHRSRFLVADLTDENAGAYWEAGFAEGLGRPVIYTCREDVFDEGGTHFDTNHHLTVKWSADDLEAASCALAATIRATLPDEAAMEDNSA
jgi:hypothetical protein